MANVVLEPYTIEADGKTVTLLPFMEDEELYEALVTYSNSDVIFMHQELSGAVYDTGKATQSMIVAPKKPVIISGHIHKSQEVGNVVYVGSLVQDRFSMSKIETKGAGTYDTSTGKMKLMLNKASKHYVVARSVEEALKFKPDDVVIKLYSDDNKAEVAAVMKDYEYVQVRKPRLKDDSAERQTMQINIETNPTLLLRSFISEDKPEALPIFDKYNG
jgi:hypothetical protein